MLIAPTRTRMGQFRRDTRGGVLVLFALMMPVLMGLSAAAIEYAGLVKRRTELQRSADTGSIAGVNQFKLANADDGAAIRTAEAMARAQARGGSAGTTEIKAVVVGDHRGVRVTISEQVPLTLGKLINQPTITVSVQSTAKLAGTTRLCMLALDSVSMGAFHLENSARLTAPDCSLYSNSMHPASIQGENLSVARALAICSAGGYEGAGANFTPPPATGCPPLRDPLAGREKPVSDSCIDLGFFLNPKRSSGGIDDLLYGENVVSGNGTLKPGTYCGGLHITKGARVTLQPGVYIIKNGPLVVDKDATLTGTNVGFYFTGARGGLLFDENSSVSLTAPRDGIMAGLLFFEDSNAPPPVPALLPLSGRGPAKAAPGGLVAAREYRIISDNTRILLGTIYLPLGRLIIDSRRSVADQSAYTVIVARMITLYGGPNLVLNANYEHALVPLPEGLGPSSADTQLTQ
jgi:Flp pilus assembly protein TadG